jgi:hypothetical protein
LPKKIKKIRRQFTESPNCRVYGQDDRFSHKIGCAKSSDHSGPTVRRTEAKRKTSAPKCATASRSELKIRDSVSCRRILEFPS